MVRKSGTNNSYSYHGNDSGNGCILPAYHSTKSSASLSGNNTVNIEKMRLRFLLDVIKRTLNKLSVD